MNCVPGWAGAFVLAFVLRQTAWAAQEPVEGDPTAAPTVEVQQKIEATEEESGFVVHGIGYLSFLTPYEGRPSLNLFLFQGELKATDGTWGVFATPRLKITPVGGENDQTYLFFQQAYGFARHDYGEVKAGKIYQRFGRLWDYGFYGPLLANDDLKLQPDLGVAAEGAPEVAPGINLEYAGQYFVADGRSLSVRNAQIFASSNVRRRNILVLRVAPTVHFDSLTTLAVGVSGSRFEATYDGHIVRRAAVDVNFSHGPISAFVEGGRQDGADLASASGFVPSHNYLWAGVVYKHSDWLNARMHANLIKYDADRRMDVLYQPGVEVNFTENWGAMAEVVWWNSASAQADKYKERSFYLIGTGRF